MLRVRGQTYRALETTAPNTQSRPSWVARLLLETRVSGRTRPVESTAGEQVRGACKAEQRGGRCCQQAFAGCLLTSPVAPGVRPADRGVFTGCSK